jgi:hypothetical protein
MTAALEGREWSARPGRTLTQENTLYPFYRRLGGPQGRSKRAENLVPTGIRSPDRPARSQSLYRLSYPAYILKRVEIIISGCIYSSFYRKKLKNSNSLNSIGRFVFVMRDIVFSLTYKLNSLLLYRLTSRVVLS